MHVTLKSLVGRLNDGCRTALEGAAGLCLTRTHYDVDLEHLFLKLLEMPNSDLKLILQAFEVNPSRLERDLTLALDKFKMGNARTPAFAPQLSTLIEEAWLLASLEFGSAKVRSGHLLLAFLSKESLSRVARDISKEFSAISVEQLDKEFEKITTGSAEAQSAVGLGEQPASGGEVGQGPLGGKTKALDQFTST